MTEQDRHDDPPDAGEMDEHEEDARADVEMDERAIRETMKTYTVVFAYTAPSGAARLFYDAIQAENPRQAAINLARSMEEPPDDVLVFRGEHTDTPPATPESVEAG